MRVSPDDIRTQLHEGEYTYGKHEEVWAEARRQVREHLADSPVLVLMVGLAASGKSSWIEWHGNPRNVYVDATLTLPKWREPFIRIAQDLDKPVVALHVPTPLNVCLERNSQRPEGRRVPDEYLRRWDREIRENLPARSEGFDKVFKIGRFDQSSSFVWVVDPPPQYVGKIPLREATPFVPVNPADHP